MRAAELFSVVITYASAALNLLYSFAPQPMDGQASMGMVSTLPRLLLPQLTFGIILLATALVNTFSPMRLGRVNGLLMILYGLTMFFLPMAAPMGMILSSVLANYAMYVLGALMVSSGVIMLLQPTMRPEKTTM